MSSSEGDTMQKKKLIPLTKNICLCNYTYFSYSYAISKYKLKIAT